MRIILAAAVLVMAPCLALGQSLPLRHPADVNRDGLVTEDEKADYAARKASDAPELPVAEPRPGGADRRAFPGRAPRREIPGNVSDQISPAPHASEFQAAMDAKDRKDRAEADD